MRYSWTALLVLSVYAAPVSAQASRGAPPPNTTPLKHKVTQPPPSQTKVTRPPLGPVLLPIQLEDQWTTAVVKRDTRTFNQLLAPNFVYTEDASVMNRDDVIKSVTGPDKVDWARNEGMKVHDFGDVQVITGVLHVKGKGTKGAFDRRYQFTDTWQRRNGRWQIIAAQDYLMPR
ncbi:MAG: nuclear transport factor 2 family protein [Gemmatimonadota bacterium]|nr:nuclear transport factor 2 family protein [Gemmatimonadota bacterium]